MVADKTAIPSGTRLNIFFIIILVNNEKFIHFQLKNNTFIIFSWFLRANLSKYEVQLIFFLYIYVFYYTWTIFGEIVDHIYEA